MERKATLLSIQDLTRQQRTRRLVETAVMLALATVLSMIKLFEAPFGGSITLVSMLPVIVIAYRYGLRWGLLSGLTYGLLQLVTGLDALKGATVATVVGAIAFDFLLGFGVCGFGALFRNLKSQKIGLPLGTLVACILRFICHFVSGILFWSIYAADYDMTPVYYSLAYNGGFMGPETAITLVAVVLLSLVLDFRSEDITARLPQPDHA